MSIKAGLQTLLIGEASIGVGNKVFVTFAPQGVSPDYIVLTRMDEDEYPTFDGTGTDLKAASFDIDCKGTTAARAEYLAKRVADFLKDYTGPAGEQTIAAVILEGKADDFEESPDGKDEGKHVVTLDVLIQFRG